MNQSNTEKTKSWNRFYQIAGTAALLIVLMGMVDIVVSMSAGEAQENTAVAVSEWFALLQTNRFAALCNLGLINITTLSLGTPVFLALYHVHRRADPAAALLSAGLFFIGTAVYISSNTLFAMLTLSNQYAVAPEAQKPLLEAAGMAALAQGADLTPGTFVGLLFTQTAGLLMASVMLRGGIMDKKTAWLGLAGYACMLVFFALTAFAPALFDTALLISMVGGLALMAYHILFARRLFELGNPAP